MHAPAQAVFSSRLGSFDSRQTPVLKTDVLVIGAGVAGASAAIEAANAGSSVLCLTKSPFDETNTASAQGGVAAALTELDSEDLHLSDTLSVGAGLSDPIIARRIIRDGPAAVGWLESLGAKFDRDPDGAYQLGREGGHSVHRVIHADGVATGAEIQRTLVQALEAHPQITCLVGAFVRDLLVDDGRCVGAVISRRNSEDLAVEAGSVIMATGGSGQVFRETTNPKGACGDGIALCFRAGAQLADMEFVQFHPTTLYIAGASRFLISEVVRGAGAVLRDRDGVQFMQGQHPLADLAPRDVVSRAILERMVQTGDTHVYLDLREVDCDPHQSFPMISKICRSFDIDIASDLIPVRPGAHYFLGGAKTDAQGHTDLPGLFAVGEASATYFHGANRLASNSLLEGAVLGRASGAAASQEAERVSLPLLAEGPTLHGETPGLHLEDMLYSLKSLMWRQVGLLRNQTGLEEALQRLTLWHHYLVKGPLPRKKACELTNMLTVSALAATAALSREESRGTHFRTDHPERQDASWCRHVLQKRMGDGTIQTKLGELTPPSDKE